MKKIIISFLFFINTITIAFAHDSCFIDTSNHWAKDIINRMVKDGVVTGSDENCFYPDKEVTIAEFLKMIIEQSDYKLNTNGNRWPDWYINTAIENEIIFPEDYIDYNVPLKRIEGCKILANYINLRDVQKTKKSFSDLSKDNKELVLKLVHLGVINGYSDNTFRENDVLTRAQACKVIASAYDAKNELIQNRKYAISNYNSNLGSSKSGDLISNRFLIENNRIKIIDFGRYAKYEDVTLNQEYINDKNVIKLLNALVDDSSYTAVLFVPDKYTINALNVCYGSRQEYVNDGNYIFQFRFYENGNYNLRESTGIDSFGEKVYMKIELDRMWDKMSEYENEFKASKKNLAKLEKALKALFNEKISKQLIIYLKAKLSEIKNIPNDEFEPKICETVKFGTYTFDVLCTRDEKIQLYVRR